MSHREKEQRPDIRSVRLICTDCNDFSTLTPEEFQLHLNQNKGNPEEICHCGGIMVLLDNTDSDPGENSHKPVITRN